MTCSILVPEGIVISFSIYCPPFPLTTVFSSSFHPYSTFSITFGCVIFNKIIFSVLFSVEIVG